jgi:hypothetical protein
MKKKYLLIKVENGETLYYSCAWHEEWNGYRWFWDEFTQSNTAFFESKHEVKKYIEMDGLETTGYFEIKKVYF